MKGGKKKPQNGNTTEHALRRIRRGKNEVPRKCPNNNLKAEWSG
jgi:hypothetical protein